MWGIFNEIGHQPEAAPRGVELEAELTELNKFVKETDPSRMTVGASNQAVSYTHLPVPGFAAQPYCGAERQFPESNQGGGVPG